MKKNGIIFGMFLCLLCCGCAGGKTEGKTDGKQSGAAAADLMQEVREEGVEIEAGQAGNGIPEEIFYADTADFAIELLKEAAAGSGAGGADGEYKNINNVTVSPLSVMTALAMTANGARGDTLDQMLSVLGKNQDMDGLNRNLSAWADRLTDRKKANVSVANSLWFREDEQIPPDKQFRPEKEFLEKNAFYYDADIYRASFPEDALSGINKWAEEKTAGKIRHVLDKIDEDDVMCLVNTVVFDARWKSVYKEYMVNDGTFTNAGGEKEDVFYMHSTEDTFIEDENAIGFVKPYKEGFRFVAILPNEGITPEEYVQSMDGEKFLHLLSEAKTDAIVETSLPKFEAEYEADLGSMLTAMGMKNAFDREAADFSGMGSMPGKNLYIGRVLHKTCISVGELGTEAIAATAVEVAAEAAAEDEIEIHRVYLRRPFVYAIVENETNVPVFIGILNTVA